MHQLPKWMPSDESPLVVSELPWRPLATMGGCPRAKLGRRCVEETSELIRSHRRNSGCVRVKDKDKDLQSFVDIVDSLQTLRMAIVFHNFEIWNTRGHWLGRLGALAVGGDPCGGRCGRSRTWAFGWTCHLADLWALFRHS